MQTGVCATMITPYARTHRELLSRHVVISSTLHAIFVSALHVVVIISATRPQLGIEDDL